MPRSTHRRRYLELLSTGFLGLVAGCTAGPGGAGGNGLGMTAGGAQDVADFRNNVEEGYLPLPESLSYEGLFSEYYFDTGGGGDCESLFCASYSPGVSPDPLAEEPERYFTVGLDSGRSRAAFERPAVNLVVVLDVSGSMSSRFDQYYYDPDTGERREVEGDIDVLPEDGLGRWEQTSQRLQVTSPYGERIRRFRKHYRTVANELGDDALLQELETMNLILSTQRNAGSETTGSAPNGTAAAVGTGRRSSFGASG